MNAFINDNILSILSLLFGTGGVGFAMISRVLYRKKYDQEVRQAIADADLKSDAFWKSRYDVLNEEIKSKDEWWRNRYTNVYNELQNERQLSNGIIKSFRAELSEIRGDYENQRRIDKDKYNELLSQYEAYRKETYAQNELSLKRINQLENLVSEYEHKLKKEQDYE